MAQEAAPDLRLVNPTSLDCNNFSYFFLNPTFADLEIIIGNESIPTHKTILCGRCRGLAMILLENPQQISLSFDDVDTKGFKKFLRFLYFGFIDFDDIDLEILVELIKLAERFSVELLRVEIIKNCEKFLTVDSCCRLFELASLTQIEDLTTKIVEVIVKNFDQLQDSFNQLTQEGMSRLINRDDLNLPELKILESVKNWRQYNQDINNLVLNSIRLSRFSKKELLSLVRPSKLFDRDTLLDTLEKLEDGTVLPQFRHIDLEKRNSCRNNIASLDSGAKVISGDNTSKLLSNDFNSKEIQDYAYHIIDDKSRIKIKLKQISSFNNITFRLYDADKEFCYSYYIQASTDNRNWVKILDYSEITCRSQQNLYFQTVSAKFIEIIGTASNTTNRLYLGSVAIYFRSEIPTVVNGIIRPKENIATRSNTVVFGTGNPDTLLDENNNYYLDSNILIQLAQPYLLSTAKLILTTWGKYFVETSVNQTDWEEIINNRNIFSLGNQYWEFKERPVVFIRITPIDRSFFCQHLVCPAQPPKKN